MQEPLRRRELPERRTLTQEQVTAAAKEKVLDALGEAASKLRAELGEWLMTMQKFDVPLAEATTSSLEARLDLQRFPSDPVPQRLPLQQFHRDEGSPLGVIDFVDGANVRVVQGGRGFGFPLEAAESLCVVGEFFRKELQGDVATELQVFRFVDHTHATTADLREDAVMGNRLPHGLRR